MLVNRNKAEAPGCERISKDRVNAYANPRWTAGRFAQHEVAGLRAVQIGNWQLAALALVDRRKPVAVAIATNDAEHELDGPRKLLHRMSDKPGSCLFSSRKNPLTNPKCAALYALNNSDPWRRGLGVPLF